MSHIMLDLETMGTAPFSPVIAIGAYKFKMDDPMGDSFYQSITLESCMRVGLVPSASTILWWMNQSESARAVFNDPSAVALPIALDAFADWLNSCTDEIWGNSARFDCGLLEACYKACDKKVPWEHWNEGCYRTLKNLPSAKGIPFERIGTYHNALDDAVSQAMHLRKIFKHLNL